MSDVMTELRRLERQIHASTEKPTMAAVRRKFAEVVDDPDSTPEEVKKAKRMLEALDEEDADARAQARRIDRAFGDERSPVLSPGYTDPELARAHLRRRGLL